MENSHTKAVLEFATTPSANGGRVPSVPARQFFWQPLGPAVRPQLADLTTQIEAAGQSIKATVTDLPRLTNPPTSLGLAPSLPAADHLQTSQCFAPAQAAGSNQARDLALTQPRFALLPEVDGRCQTARRLKPGDGPLGGPKQDRVLRIAAARLVRVGCFV